MVYVITIFGILICAAALVGLVVPTTLTSLATAVAESKRLRVTVTVIRFVFGAIAILGSNYTHYPLAMKVIGVVAIMAGTVTAMVNSETLQKWVDRFRRDGNLCRVASLAALAVGGFLIHATT